MRKHMISKAMRLFLFVFSTIIWTGIWLTGFDVVHWLLFVPPSFGMLAAITGICPGIIFSKMIVGEREG